tara:strand:- start:804 stop:1049 length:246 start_codon:yes stop_codon:yes gene_type:complete
MILEDYREAVEGAVEIDFIAQSGDLTDQLNDVFIGAAGFQITGISVTEISQWFNYFEGMTFRDLIDWVWKKLKELWEKYFG